MTLKVTNIRMMNSEDVEHVEFDDRLDEAVTAAMDKNAHNASVGYSPEWRTLITDPRTGEKFKVTTIWDS